MVMATLFDCLNSSFLWMCWLLVSYNLLIDCGSRVWKDKARNVLVQEPCFKNTHYNGVSVCTSTCMWSKIWLPKWTDGGTPQTVRCGHACFQCHSPVRKNTSSAYHIMSMRYLTIYSSVIIKHRATGYKVSNIAVMYERIRDICR